MYTIQYSTSCCKTSMVTCKVLLDVDRACEAAKVATEVVYLLLVEVLVADGVDVVDVLCICFVNVVLVNVFLKLFLILFTPRLYGRSIGHGQWKRILVVLLLEARLYFTVVLLGFTGKYFLLPSRVKKSKKARVKISPKFG